MADVMGLDPELRRRLEAWSAFWRRFGFRVTVTSGRRSHQQQRQLYQRRQRGEQPFPVAVPGCSTHEYGLAFDAVVQPAPSAEALRQVALVHGLVWGPSDAVHYQPFTLAEWRQATREAGLPC